MDSSYCLKLKINFINMSSIKEGGQSYHQLRKKNSWYKIKLVDDWTNTMSSYSSTMKSLHSLNYKIDWDCWYSLKDDLVNRSWSGQY